MPTFLNRYWETTIHLSQALNVIYSSLNKHKYHISSNTLLFY